MSGIPATVISTLALCVVSLISYIAVDKLDQLDAHIEDETAALGRTVDTEIEEITRDINASNQRLERKIQASWCRMYRFESENEYRSIEEKFDNTWLGDLTHYHPLVRRIGFKRTQFSNALDFCSREDRWYASYFRSLDEGVRALLDRKPEEALRQFGNLPDDRSLTQRLLAMTKHRLALTYEPGSARRLALFNQASADTARALELIENEARKDQKRINANILRCQQQSYGEYIGTIDEAISCWEEIAQDEATHRNVYYNIAALYSRSKRYEKAIRFFDAYLNHGGTQDYKLYVWQDQDFAGHILTDPGYADEFRALINRMVY